MAISQGVGWDRGSYGPQLKGAPCLGADSVEPRPYRIDCEFKPERFGAEEAGWRSAVIYSIITNCRSRGIDPHAYLKDFLMKLPTATNRQQPSYCR